MMNSSDISSVGRGARPVGLDAGPVGADSIGSNDLQELMQMSQAFRQRMGGIDGVGNGQNFSVEQGKVVEEQATKGLTNMLDKLRDLAETDPGAAGQFLEQNPDIARLFSESFKDGAK